MKVLVIPSEYKGKKVTAVGVSAFFRCAGLTSITIPGSVTSISWMAFSDCAGLTSIAFTGTRAEWKTVIKGDSWADGVPATVVHCTDGDVAI